MIIEYCQKAIERAEYKKLDDGSWFGEIPGFQVVWTNCDSVEKCRNELVTVLEEWLLLKVRDCDTVPDLAGLKVEIREVAVG